MVFETRLRIGQEVTNEELSKEFRCGTQSGMRPSNRTNTLIIVSNNIKSIYLDRWEGTVLHYTGQGKVGDQELKNNNLKLAESKMNGIGIHLFEVYKPKIYTYLGQVELCAEPYQEKQYDENNDLRKVWMFPIKLITDKIVTEYTDIQRVEELHKKRAKKIALYDLKKITENKENKPTSVRETLTKTYVRNQYVAEYARRCADGKCELCGYNAPFNDLNDSPYLEAHHIIWLSKNGKDSNDNIVALCPNCHRKMHVLDLSEDVLRLKEVVKLRETKF